MGTRKLAIAGCMVLITICLIVLPVSAYQFSMTKIETYDSLSSLYPYGTGSHTQVYNWLVGQGWSQNFYETETNVDDTDFGTTNGGLNQADLHYHFGHGDYQSSTTYVQYSNWPNSYLGENEVYKKWGVLGFPNKWVILDTCWDLIHLQWGGALKFSHGIMGFGSTKYVQNSDLPNVFLRWCIDYDYTIAYSWQLATQQVQQGDNTLVRVVFDTQDQLWNDHLPGQGTVAASEIIDDDTIYYAEWRT